MESVSEISPSQSAVFNKWHVETSRRVKAIIDDVTPKLQNEFPDLKNIRIKFTLIPTNSRNLPLHNIRTTKIAISVITSIGEINGSGKLFISDDSGKKKLAISSAMLVKKISEVIIRLYHRLESNLCDLHKNLNGESLLKQNDIVINSTNLELQKNSVRFHVQKNSYDYDFSVPLPDALNHQVVLDIIKDKYIQRF